MIAIDTNIIVRFLTRDDENQFQKSLKLFEKHDVFIPDTVILETEWVLRYAYNFEPVAISKAFSKLFGLSNVHLSNPILVAQALDWHLHGLDFSDALHLTQCQKFSHFYTFDNKFINKSKDLSNCAVVQPL